MALNINDGTNPPDERPKPDRLHLWQRETLEERYRAAVNRERELENLKGQTAQYLARLEEDYSNVKAKVEAYEAGREVYDQVEAYEAGRELTPGQLWHRLLSSTEDQRLALLTSIIEHANTASDCFTRGHAGLTRQAEYDREQLSIAVFDMPTSDSTAGLHVAVRALRQLMVDGLAARVERIEHASTDLSDAIEDLTDFPQEKGTAEKIAEQLDAAGISLTAKCGWEWVTVLDEPDPSICTQHHCGLTNPLHATSHECAGCGAIQTQEEAERQVMSQ